MEDYTKRVLIGGGSPGYLNISNLLIAAVHDTHINTCNVWILLLTYPCISTSK